jgi:1-acyl-sn-glycerol-3-phosphate acyltransferase
MTQEAASRAAQGRHILIFPEGTRRAPGAPPAYKPGIALLYDKLNIPCVPVALNSGLFWPRRSLTRRPGTIIVEFLPAIPPGLPRKEFVGRLQQAVETATAKLVAEGRNETSAS